MTINSRNSFGIVLNLLKKEGYSSQEPYPSFFEIVIL